MKCGGKLHVRDDEEPDVTFTRIEHSGPCCHFCGNPNHRTDACPSRPLLGAPGRYS